MADLPNAGLVIDDAAGALAGNTGYAVVFGCAATLADQTPRVFASAKGLLDTHGYCQGADYVALHIDATRQPVIFVALPIVTAGVLGRVNSSGVTGNSAITISAAASGYLEETDCSIKVVNGGTIGAAGITFNFSADGGRTNKLIRLGTASSYVVPYLGIVLNFAAGTLVAGDVYTFSTTAPLWDSAGLTAGRTALATQQKLARSWVVTGDLPNSTYAGYVTTQADAYETANERFIYARTSVRDQLPLASKSKNSHAMTGAPNLTFTEVDDLADTITRSAGSFITDGFAVGDFVKVSKSGGLNDAISGKIATLTATVLTFTATDVAAEGPVGGYSIVGSESLVFTTTTCTRSVGSWLSDGFRVGDSVTFSGTASNNITETITVLTATVLTFASGGAAETIGSADVTAVKGETRAVYVAAMDAAFASVDAEKRFDASIGRARVLSPITAWQFRRPAAWAASIREYQHDVQIPSWRKSDGPLLGWDMTDGNGKVIEFDERTDGGALAARFTCLRTWANGPNGAFVALSLTRATEGSLLSRTHNMAVTNVACTVTQAETENAIGQVLVLDDAGHGTADSLQKIEERVNSQLQINLLQARTEGQRASKAVWVANKTDVLNVPGATLNGVLTLNLNGTIEKISTRVRIQTAGS